MKGSRMDGAFAEYFEGILAEIDRVKIDYSGKQQWEINDDARAAINHCRVMVRRAERIDRLDDLERLLSYRMARTYNEYKEVESLIYGFDMAVQEYTQGEKQIKGIINEVNRLRDYMTNRFFMRSCLDLVYRYTQERIKLRDKKNGRS